MYKNSILVKFWRTFEIEIKEDQIKLRTFFQLQFMKETVKLDQTFVKMIDRVIIDLSIVERHLERVIQMFLQFDKEYVIFPLEAMPYIDARRNKQHLMLEYV
jgi:hypothetical protein